MSASHSLIGSVSEYVAAPDASNLLGVDPLLGSLSANDGPTLTHALPESSPAIDSADGSLCANAIVAGVDQRGAARPQGESCDMGAFEAVVEATPAPVVDALNIDEAGTIDRDTGTAVVSVTVTCTVPGEITLQVALSQEQRQRRLRITVSGSSTATVHCDGVTGWAVSIAGDDGVFTNGLVQMSSQTVDATPADTGPQQGRLLEQEAAAATRHPTADPARKAARPSRGMPPAPLWSNLTASRTSTGHFKTPYSLVMPVRADLGGGLSELGVLTRALALGQFLLAPCRAAWPIVGDACR